MKNKKNKENCIKRNKKKYIYRNILHAGLPQTTGCPRIK